MLCFLPESIFFPYTTLFRSILRCTREDGLRLGARAVHEQTRSREVPVAHFGVIDRRAGIVHTKVSEDRKSTRLNSSHQIISYAVFCLKKKRLQIPEPSPRVT